jgi:hypothetical protein
MTLKDRIKAEVAALDVRARPWAARSRWHARAYEFLLFGLKQAWACLFGALMLACWSAPSCSGPRTRPWRATISWSSPRWPSRSRCWR